MFSVVIEVWEPRIVGYEWVESSEDDESGYAIVGVRVPKKGSWVPLFQMIRRLIQFGGGFANAFYPEEPQRGGGGGYGGGTNNNDVPLYLRRPEINGNETDIILVGDNRNATAEYNNDYRLCEALTIIPVDLRASTFYRTREDTKRSTSRESSGSIRMNEVTGKFIDVPAEFHQDALKSKPLAIDKERFKKLNPDVNINELIDKNEKQRYYPWSIQMTYHNHSTYTDGAFPNYDDLKQFRYGGDLNSIRFNVTYITTFPSKVYVWDSFEDKGYAIPTDVWTGETKLEGVK